MTGQTRNWHEPTRLAWFSLGSLAVVEIAIDCGVDFGVIDLQHGLWHKQSAHDAIGLIGPDRALVRAADSSETAVSQALDTGAAGVIVPVVETAAQARQAVAASRFAPHGTRSAGGVRPIAKGFGRYLEEGHRAVAAMIETRAGVENVSEIAAVDGIDFLFVGPGDLSLSLGVTPDTASLFDEALDTILAAAAAAAAERPCGIFTPFGRSCAEMMRRGFSVFTVADDISVVQSGFQAAVREACPS